MTLGEAQAAVRGGARFGDVYPALVGTPAEIEEFRRWFVRDLPPSAPNRGTTQPRDATFAGRPAPVQTGSFCRCGGLMVRTGTCETCSSCGASSGGCG